MKTKPVKATAKFVSKKQLTSNVFEFTFRMLAPAELDYLPGQYITIEVDKKTRRQYSISTSPQKSKSEFSIIVDVSPKGPGIRYLLSIQLGEEIAFVGQIGLFGLPKELKKKLYFIATGTGISPLKAMIDTLVDTKECNQHEINLIFGARTQKDIIYENLFKKYLKEEAISAYEVYLSREESESGDYKKGRVTDYVNSLSVGDVKDAQFFLCGGGDMIKDAEKILKKKGANDSCIFYERYY